MPDLPELFDLSGRVAAVTGGAGLLGIEFCKTLAQAGAVVVIADVDGKSAARVAESLNRMGFRAIGLKTDVTQRTSVHRMVSTGLEKFGRLDILVNSAAIDPKFDPEHIRVGEEGAGQERPSAKTGIPFEEYPQELWNQALTVNLTGMFLACQAAVRPMLDQGSGVIINLCSIYGLVGPDQRIYRHEKRSPLYKPAFYSVTKAGVLGLTRYLAAYYAGKNIRVNALTPGGVYNEHDDEFVKSYSMRAVLGRMAEKTEFNGALLFLASDASSYMTGANLVVDGGWTAW